MNLQKSNRRTPGWSLRHPHDKLSLPPRGFDASHAFVDDLKMKDFVTSVPLSEEQICSANLMRDFVSACQKMSPLVEFTTKALGLKF